MPAFMLLSSPFIPDRLLKLTSAKTSKLFPNKLKLYLVGNFILNDVHWNSRGTSIVYEAIKKNEIIK